MKGRLFGHPCLLYGKMFRAARFRDRNSGAGPNTGKDDEVFVRAAVSAVVFVFSAFSSAGRLGQLFRGIPAWLACFEAASGRYRLSFAVGAGGSHAARILVGTGGTGGQ